MPKEELLIAGKEERERGRGRASRRDDDDDDDDGSSRYSAMPPPGPGTAAGDTKMDRVASVSGCMDAWMGPKATTGGKSYGGGDNIASLMEGEIVGNVHSFISFAGGGEDTDSGLC